MSRISLHLAPGRRHQLTRIALGARWRFVGPVAFAAMLSSHFGCESAEESGSAAVPLALRGLAMTDENGRVLTAEMLEGKLVLLNFMFTSCPGPCPRITELMVKARELLPGAAQAGIRFISVSVDPDNDTPSVLNAFAQKHSANAPTWSFVSISPQDLDILAGRLTVFDPTGQKAPPAHSTKLYLFDRRGRALQRYDGNLVTPPHLARELAAAERLHREN